MSEQVAIKSWEQHIQKPAKPEALNNNSGGGFAPKDSDRWFRRPDYAPTESRPDVYYEIKGSKDGTKKYAYLPLPDRDGAAFKFISMKGVRLHKGTKKDGTHMFNTVNMLEDIYAYYPNTNEILEKDPSTLSPEELKIAENIKLHASLMRRHRNIFRNKIAGVSFGFLGAGKSNDIRASRITSTGMYAGFGVWTKWAGKNNDNGDKGVKFIKVPYVAVMDSITSNLNELSEEQSYEGVTDIMETFFNPHANKEGEFKICVSFNMGDMSPSGSGCSTGLTIIGEKVGADKANGVNGKTYLKDVVIPTGEENELSLLHYALGIKSNEVLWQDEIAEDFDTALTQLEAIIQAEVERQISQGKDPWATLQNRPSSALSVEEIAEIAAKTAAASAGSVAVDAEDDIPTM